LPLYDFVCPECGCKEEVVVSCGSVVKCEKCHNPMERLFPTPALVKEKYPLWVDRIDEIHKRQADKGERLRYVHPREVIR
jgi:putative FmdB family regulatory protein